MPLKLIVCLKFVFDASGNTGMGITMGHESLKLIMRELTKYGRMGLMNWRPGEPKL